MHYLLYRIEYDAYRCDLETATLSGGVTANNETIEDLQKQYDDHRQSYEKLKQDVSVKLKFLDENRVNIYRCLIVDILMINIFINVSIADQGYAQAASALSQCCIGLLQRQRLCFGSYIKTV